jgi:hypothetical protein
LLKISAISQFSRKATSRASSRIQCRTRFIGLHRRTETD